MVCAALFTFMLSLTPAQAAPPDSPLVSSRIEDRVIKRFDFDERKLGNYESMPRFWRRMTEPEFPGYPRYLEPLFDLDVGHNAAPSFRFDLDGGNIGAQYVSKDINVHPLADYRVTAWVRTSGLEQARAHITAHYLDHALRKIEKSERSSRIVQDVDAAGWTQISVHLPGGFDRARWIGISCRVEQAPERVGTVQELRPINYRDIRGSAWFDDITIVRLPRVGIELDTTGAIFPAEREVACTVRVADLDGVGINSRLDLFDAESQPLGTHTIRTVGLDDKGVRVSLGDMPPGLYSALLTVEVDGTPIVRFAQPFLRLSADLRSAAEASTHAFGVNFRPLDGLGESDQRYLLEQLSAGVVKTPLWRRDVTDADVLWGDDHLGGLLKTLSDEGIEVVASLEDPPGTLAEQYGHPDLTLLDVLSSSPEKWRPYLALMLARYGPYIRAWQVGADDRPILRGDRRLATAISNVRTELHPLIGASDLSGPRGIYDRSGAKSLPAEIVAVSAPSTMSADAVGLQMSSFEGEDMPRRWATIELPQRDRYDRRTRLIEFARRIVTALQCGAETVFIPQPWGQQKQGGTKVLAPLEEFILYRTLTQTLGDKRPVTPVWLDHGISAWMFGANGSEDGSLVLWSDGDEPSPRTLQLQLDDRARRIDLWGNAISPTSESNRKNVAVDAMPAIVSPVSMAQLRTMAGFAIDQDEMRPDVLEQDRVLTLANPRSIKMHGMLRLKAPKGWRVSPKHHAVDLDPGESATLKVRVLVPSNQAVGDYTLRGRLELEGDPLDGLRLQLPLKVAVPELDVGVAARMEGDKLLVRHRITNRSEDSLSLRAVMIAPGFARQVRIIQHLAPGQTAVRQFELEGASALAGAKCRVSVEQVDGAIRHNQLVRIGR